MGCITIVENTATNYMTQLPVYRYNNVEDIINIYLSDKSVSDAELDTPEIKLSHWKNLIHSKRSELF